MNRITENSCNSQPRAVTDRARASSCWSSMNCWTAPSGSLKASIASWALMLKPNVSLRKLHGTGDVALGVGQQLGDLRPDERADGGDEQEEDDHDPEQDQRRRRAASPAAAGEAVDSGLDGQRQEQRDRQEDDEVVEPGPDRPDDEGGEGTRPEDDRRRDDPARHSSFRWRDVGSGSATAPLAARNGCGPRLTGSSSPESALRVGFDNRHHVRRTEQILGEIAPRRGDDAALESEPAGHLGELGGELLGDRRTVEPGCRGRLRPRSPAPAGPRRRGRP